MVPSKDRFHLEAASKRSRKEIAAQASIRGYTVYITLIGTSIFTIYVLAGPGSGVPFHIHGPTFAETIFGRKVCVHVCVGGISVHV